MANIKPRHLSYVGHRPLAQVSDNATIEVSVATALWSQFVAAQTPSSWTRTWLGKDLLPQVLGLSVSVPQWLLVAVPIQFLITGPLHWAAHNMAAGSPQSKKEVSRREATVWLGPNLGSGMSFFLHTPLTWGPECQPTLTGRLHENVNARREGLLSAILGADGHIPIPRKLGSRGL